jgi:hypothetical protein
MPTVNTRPPSIKFYEDESLSTGSSQGSRLLRFIRTHSLGIIRNDTQAGLLIIVVLALATWWGATFIKTHQSVEPTRTFDILPQESVGSTQGLPQKASPYEKQQ